MPSRKEIILDTFKINNNQIYLKDLHLQRTYEAALFLNTEIELSLLIKIYNEIELQLISNNTNENKLIRLLLNPMSPENYQLEIKILENTPNTVSVYAMATKNPPDLKNQFKFADRHYWLELLKLMPEGFDDILLLNENSQAIECSRFNVFSYDHTNDIVYTPELNTGCLNGVYRRYVLMQKKIFLPEIGFKTVIEKNFTLGDSIFLANSVREVLKAKISF